MTFSEYIIDKKGKNFYYVSLEIIINNKTTLETHLSEIYSEYKTSYDNRCSPDNCRHGY